MKWRITLRCGCVYQVAETPDLARPMICGVDDHGMKSIISAERL